MRERATLTAFFVTLAGAMSLAPAATAGEGQIEINQTLAVAGNVTPGDAPGFPITISRSGSYRLTSDLLVRGGSAASTDGISIEADHVTLDMAGFTIRCEVPNLPAPLPCAGVGGGGSGDGISLLFAENVRIVNGTIRDFAQHGVFASQTGTDYQLHAMRIFDNGRNGVESRANGLISQSAIMNNGDVGIHVDAFGALIVDTTTYGNANGGVEDGNGTVSAATSAFRDGGIGITSADVLTCITFGLGRICP